MDLLPLERPVLPALPRRTRAEGGAWSARTREIWDAWRQDPTTGQYGPSDIAYALDTIRLVELGNAKPTATLLAEVRLRLDGLGLTPKGKRSLRWRIAEPAGVVELPGSRSRRRRHLEAAR